MPEDEKGELSRREQLRSDLESLRLERAPLSRRPPGRARRWVLALLAVALIVAAAVAWDRRAVPVALGEAERVRSAELGPVPVLSGSGYVVTADRYVSVGVRVPGRIERYFVEEGQSVRAGESLVQLDDRDYRAAVTGTEARLAVARADLTLAEAELERGRVLRKDGVVSRQEFDVLQNKAAVAAATAEQLEAELAQVRVNLEYTLLRAPSDGIVLAKLKEVGEIAVPGGFAGSGDLVRLANLNEMRAEVDVNEADLNRVRLGQAAHVIPDAYPDRRYAAEVVKLYPQVDRQKGTLKIEVHILEPDAKLLPDMSARITFLESSGQGQEIWSVLVPADAVRRDTAGDTFVWVVNGGRADKRIVETGGDIGDRVRVARGLEGGERIVLGDRPLRDGQRVRVAPDAPVAD